eukprot:Awhi_evm1s6417
MSSTRNEDEDSVGVQEQSLDEVAPAGRWAIHGTNMAPLSSGKFKWSDHRYSWRDKLLHVLHHKYLHYTLIFILIVDVMIVITGIALEIQYLESEVQGFEHLLEECIHDPANPPHEPFHAGNSTFHDVEIILGYISIGILFIFLIENVLLMIALGHRYFMSVFYVLDITVVVASIVLEFLFQNNLEGGLLVFARTWRFARIAHGLYESTHNGDERALTKLYAKHKRPLRIIHRLLKGAKEDAGDDVALQAKAQKEVLASLDDEQIAVVNTVLFNIGNFISNTHKKQKLEGTLSTNSMDTIADAEATESYQKLTNSKSADEMGMSMDATVV